MTDYQTTHGHTWCQTCGAVIHDIEAHTRREEAIDRLLNEESA